MKLEWKWHDTGFMSTDGAYIIFGHLDEGERLYTLRDYRGKDATYETIRDCKKRAQWIEDIIREPKKKLKWLADL